MNPTHLHLMLNHVPVLGTAFGLALLAWGAWRGCGERMGWTAKQGGQIRHSEIRGAAGAGAAAAAGVTGGDHD